MTDLEIILSIACFTQFFFNQWIWKSQEKTTREYIESLRNDVEFFKKFKHNEDE